MIEDPTFFGGIWWTFSMMGEIAFRWVPATVIVFSGAAPDGGVATFLAQPITQPIQTSDVVNFLQTTGQQGAYEGLYNWWGVIVALSILLSLFFAAGLIYCLVRIFQVRHNEERRYRAAAHPVAARDVSRSQLRWNHIQEQLVTDNQQNWRLAILEADIMLNELLDLLGYKGETMADKMKQVDRGNWKTIDLAWEAHRVRNVIAHQGSTYQLSDREVRRVISLYQQVFREHRFIE